MIVVLEEDGKERVRGQIELGCDSVAKKVLGHIGHRLMLAANRHIVRQGRA